MTSNAVLSPMPSDDRDAIEAILVRQVEAWNCHDMAAFVADMTPDVDWINVVGMHWRSRETVEKAHAALHRLPLFANSRMVPGDVDVRAISPDVMLAVEHSCIENAGPTPDGGEYPKDGAIKTLILVREGDWRIAHGHVTNKLARAIAHNPGKPAA